MTSSLGLAELLFVLVGGMGWGAYELWSVRGRKKPKPTRALDDQAPPADPRP